MKKYSYYNFQSSGIVQAAKLGLNKGYDSVTLRLPQCKAGEAELKSVN